MLQNEYLVAKIGFDSAENEPLKVCQKLAKVRIKVRKKIIKHRFSPLSPCTAASMRTLTIASPTGSNCASKSAAVASAPAQAARSGKSAGAQEARVPAVRAIAESWV